MNTPASPYGKLTSADGSERNRRSLFAVHADWRRPSVSRIQGPDVEKVAVGRISRIVKQVKRTAFVLHNLRLNAAIRDTPQRNLKLRQSSRRTYKGPRESNRNKQQYCNPTNP